MSLDLPVYSPIPESASTTGGNNYKKKERMVTSFSLPRIDEMVLLQKVATRGDTSSCAMERSRTRSINEQLNRYNRWLLFTQLSNASQNVRAAGMDLQETVHEMNVMISEMMQCRS